MNMKRSLIIVFLVSTLGTSWARETRDGQRVTPEQKSRIKMYASTCEPASQSMDLDINNVRTKILNGGDMWWDLNNAKYEIPKVTDPNAVRKHALFAGAIWVGGKDEGGNLRLAAMTYRQKGVDFWPGPLDISTASTDPLRCKNYDRLWKITRDELEEYEESNYRTPSSAMKEWPAGRSRSYKIGNESNYLAPFKDINGDGEYDVFAGEHPTLYHSDPNDPKTIAVTDNGVARQPDMFIYFVYNDKGNIHSESQGQPIGLECRTTAFAFSTNDEINNMTFYTTELINWGTAKLNETYMGQWADPDLGNYADDYIGCDVTRSLGFCYNGDDEDEGVLGYGLNPPSVGIDYFQGPKDTSGKELGLSHFMYFTNGAAFPLRDPSVAIGYYNYLQGKWENGTPLTWGATGYAPGSTDFAKYAFPGKTDPDHAGLEWVETQRPGDRRFVQSTGPFTLLRGQVQRITTGVVWARTTSGGAKGSLNLLELASDKAQTLFNNNFKLVDGPEAPDVEIQELHEELVLKFLNTNTPKLEAYTEKFKDANNNTRTYAFEGYMVYQLKDGSVNTGDLDNIDKARLLFQVDLKNKFAQIINKVFDPKINQYVPVEKVNGENKGLQHTFSIKKDLFATGSNQKLNDFSPYYYMVISYAVLTDDAQGLEPNQFLAGRRNVKVYKGIPAKSDPINNGTILTSGYGSGPELTRISGRGNGGNVLEFTKETVDEILKNGFAAQPKYMGGMGPVKIKVVDPLKVPNHKFEFYLRERTNSVNAGLVDSMTANTDWVLVNKTTGDSVFSDKTIATRYESVKGVKSPFDPGKQTLLDWGLSVEVEQVKNPGEDVNGDPSNSLISWSVTFQDPGREWLTALRDNNSATQNQFLYPNWIRSGLAGKGSGTNYDPHVHAHFFNVQSGEALDPTGAYERIWGGRIAPYALAARAAQDNAKGNTFGPAWSGSPVLGNPMSELSSFELVITPDRSLWTRCPVLEMADEAITSSAEGGMPEFDLRFGTSRDRNGNPIAGNQGLSYFPGYCINLETGERMQLAFGEDSYLTGENGGDMIWNPTSTLQQGSNAYPVIGGKHFIYIFGSGFSMPNRTIRGSRYRGEDEIFFKGFKDSLWNTNPPTANTKAPTNKKQRFLSQIQWVIPTMLNPGFSMNDGVPPTEVRIKVNIKKAYTTYGGAVNNGRPFYTFSGETIAAKQSNEHGKESLDLINVVPNPYKAYSKYQASPVDTRVKITNLPNECTITIYDMAGNFIRKFEKSDPSTFVEWDLKNKFNVPIASGLYLIHVKSKTLGERIVRWYGIMPAIDLDSY